MKQKQHSIGNYIIDYDKDNTDILYIYHKKKKSHGSIEITNDIVVDFDKRGEIVGIEVFDYGKKEKSIFQKSQAPR